MIRRLFPVALALLLSGSASAKDKNKSSLPEYILRSQTVRVVIDPDAGEPIDNPNANAIARDNVERALTEWGRFRLLMDGQESDLVIVVRTGNGNATRPTIKGGPIDQRPGVAQGTDSSIRIGGQQGRPPMNDPGMDPQYPQAQGPHIGNEVGSKDDSFVVYRGDVVDPLDAPAAWRYSAKNCLGAPQVTAVEEFRKAIAEAEKPKPPKKP